MANTLYGSRNLKIQLFTRPSKLTHRISQVDFKILSTLATGPRFFRLRLPAGHPGKRHVFGTSEYRPVHSHTVNHLYHAAYRLSVSEILKVCRTLSYNPLTTEGRLRSSSGNTRLPVKPKSFAPPDIRHWPTGLPSKSHRF